MTTFFLIDSSSSSLFIAKKKPVLDRTRLGEKSENFSPPQMGHDDFITRFLFVEFIDLMAVRGRKLLGYQIKKILKKNYFDMWEGVVGQDITTR